jgi:hypothetical protein
MTCVEYEKGKWPWPIFAVAKHLVQSCVSYDGILYLVYGTDRVHELRNFIILLFSIITFI